MSFQYYIYISDAKIDMLLSQIDPGQTRKRTAKVGFDFKVLKGERGTESVAGADRVARLEQVVRFLSDFGDLGTVDEPGQFFAGSLPLRWGPRVGADGFPMVYFGGRTERTVVGLGGSRAHVFGALPSLDPDSPLSRSMLPSLLDGIAREENLAQDGALDAAHRASTELTGPAQHVEFIAKRLLHGKASSGDAVLIGSPLYIALVD